MGLWRLGVVEVVEVKIRGLIPSVGFGFGFKGFDAVVFGSGEEGGELGEEGVEMFAHTGDITGLDGAAAGSLLEPRYEVVSCLGDGHVRG